MRNFRIFIILFFTIYSSSSLASFFGDDAKDVCYNWNGDRESCSNPSLRRETHFAVEYLTYYGDELASLTDSNGYSLVLTTVRSHDKFRFLFGGQITYAGADAYINNAAPIDAKMMAADLIFGLSIKPYRNTALRPVIEIDIMGGLKSIDFTGPPAGVDEKNLIGSYGGKFSLGLDIKIGRFTSLRPALTYQVNRLPGIVDDENFVFDSLGFSLGLVSE